MKIREFTKALIGGVVAGLGSLATATLTESAAGGDITLNEWLIAGNLALVAFNAVFFTVNAQPDETAVVRLDDDTVRPGKEHTDTVDMGE